jgi:hypothetical protein
MSERRSPTVSRHRVVIDACLAEGVPFFWRGEGSLLVSGVGLLRVLGRLQADGASILGLDGFEIETADLHPRIDLIFDSSTTTGTPGEVAATWGPDIWVDITLG